MSGSGRIFPEVHETHRERLC
uniref:Uncharacterized protein n=1 Tax=Anguilla anguilla TaxID=7936 RepID=A0A0E9TEV7_ANGAN